MVIRPSFKHIAAPWILSTALAAFAAGSASPARAQLSPDIDPTFATALVRDALMVLNHANITGNYTVLHDYGARAFREANDPIDLGLAFAGLRAEGLNLMQALITGPQFRAATLSMDRSTMRLSGTVPVEGAAVDFDMEFRLENNLWRLLGLVVLEAAPSRAADPQVDIETPDAGAEPD